MNNFVVNFNVSAYENTDNIALSLSQTSSLGNKNDWFGCFRGGLYGFTNRLYGVKENYNILHAWLPIPIIITTGEYHLASCFFNMDSSVECLTFAINALGYAISADDFYDVSSREMLKKINPKNIYGEENDINPNNKALPGYIIMFPELRKLWHSKKTLIESIMEQHDVSKHRKTIYVGGQHRLDVPINFFESQGIPDDPAIRSCYWPMAEIILQNDPKSPLTERKPQEVKDFKYLENLMLEFSVFIDQTGSCLMNDLNQYLTGIK